MLQLWQLDAKAVSSLLLRATHSGLRLLLQKCQCIHIRFFKIADRIEFDFTEYYGGGLRVAHILFTFSCFPRATSCVFTANLEPS